QVLGGCVESRGVLSGSSPAPTFAASVGRPAFACRTLPAVARAKRREGGRSGRLTGASTGRPTLVGCSSPALFQGFMLRSSCLFAGIGWVGFHPAKSPPGRKRTNASALPPSALEARDR